MYSVEYYLNGRLIDGISFVGTVYDEDAKRTYLAFIHNVKESDIEVRNNNLVN